ncbi:lactonase family protein [Pseudomonas subflava]|uniref:lactonase family protein n=1 Tax=Pseudomonas subflava TaxID=2952933 RepID=UPI00207A3808|nr:lactonase family protein [Pseudomonas subflava]
MRRLVLPLCASALIGCAGGPAPAPRHELLVGCSACAGVLRLSFDPATGLLREAPLQVLPASKASWLTLSADGRRLFAIGEDRISLFQRGVDGRFEELGQQPSQGAEAVHASLTADGRQLLVAHYSSKPQPGGSLSVLLVADGLRPVVQRIVEAFTRPGSERQGSSHMHSVMLGSDGRAHACDLGADRIYAYDYRPQRPDQPLAPAEPPFLQLPAGSGPRHLRFDAAGRHAYLTLEMSNQVALLDVGARGLQLRELYHLDPPFAAGDRRLGALHLSADGRFLYVSRRGVENQLVVYAVGDDGGLRELQRRDSGGVEPREFALAPDGRFLLVANQQSDRLTVLRRDPQSGLLGEEVQALRLSTPTALKFIEGGTHD